MNETLEEKENNKLFKQRLQQAHIVTGVSFSLIMYVALFFGIFAILLPYIQVWEKPSRHFKTANPTTIDYGAMIDPVLQDENYPTINGVTVVLPGYMNDPALIIKAQFTKDRIFNPNTLQEVENEDKLSNLAMFLNFMHYGRPFKTFGYLIFGFTAVAVMFLVIGGIMLMIKIKYKNSSNTRVSFFSKWHRKIFIWLFPPFIIITLTGAMMNIGYFGSPIMTYITSKGATSNAWSLVGPILYPSEKRVELENIKAKMLPMNELLQKAKQISPNIEFQRIKITNWNDNTAIAKFEGYNPYMPFLNGISNKPYVTLSAVTGELLDKKDVFDKNYSSIIYDIIFFLHFLFGVDTFTRFFILTIMVISTFALGFGVMLYLEKKARKFPENIPIYQGFGKLSLAVMIGVIPATALLFFLQWLIPFDIESRFLIQKGLFATLWCATLTYSFYKFDSYKTVKEFLYLGGILFALSPIIHFINSNFSPLALYKEEMYNILFVDIALFVVGLILIFVARKIPINKNYIKL